MRHSAADLLQETDHLDRRQSRLVALVAHLAARTVQSLIHGLAGDNAERDWNSGFSSHTHDASRDLAVDVFVMAGRTLDHSTKADDRRILTGLSQRGCGERDLERTGDPRNGDQFGIPAMPHNRIDGTFQQAACNQIIETTDNDRKCGVSGC